MYDLLLKRGYRVKLPAVMSIYTAEAFGILPVLQYIEEHKNETNWLIVSGYMSFLTVLESNRLHDWTNYDIKTLSNELKTQGSDIIFI